MAKDRQGLLSRIAAMRGPVDFETAKVLSTYDDDNQLKEALRELVARGLLFRQEGQGRYDLHPIVRQYSYDRLGDKKAAHTALKDYFATVPKPEKIQSLEDLLPAIELFHHTIASGSYEEAFVILRDRLDDVLYFQLGAYDVLITLFQTLFPEGEDKPPRLKDESDQAWTLNNFARSCYMTGQIRKATGLQEQAIDMSEKQDRKDNVARALGNLADSQMLLGELMQAESNFRLCSDICSDLKDSWEAVGHQGLGRLQAYMGQYKYSQKTLKKALALFAQLHEEHWQGFTWSYCALRALLMDEPESALEALKKARQFWELSAQHEFPYERDLVEILWLSGAAKHRVTDLAGAEADLNEALSRCRRIRLVMLESDILLEMAKLQWQKAEDGKQNTEDRGLIEHVKSLTREALDIAERCEYRLKQADIHNFLAEMALAEGDKPTARRHAETAKERAYCDGPPYCYKKALDTAEEMLTKLGGD